MLRALLRGASVGASTGAPGCAKVGAVAEYILSEFAQERERLERIGAVHDPVTFRHLDEIGVAPGWVCAEVGGGAGAVARRLSDLVGPGGSVLATDLDTRFLDDLELANVEVRCHDIGAEELGLAEYDLVHARLVLMHVRQRQVALEHLIHALKPGGTALIEEPDFSVMRATEPGSAPVELMMVKVLAAFERAGADWRYGLKVPPALEALGMVDVVAEGELSVLRFGSERVEALVLLFENVGARLIGAGLLAPDELAAAVDALRTASPTVVCSPLIVSTLARKPIPAA